MPETVIAAVDLGSNSFRLQVSRVVHGQLYPLDALKESVRLAAGLQSDNTLSSDAQRRALECLKRFGNRLRGVPPDAVRVIGTNTLRVARKSETFLKRAEALLGAPIEIVAGQEEARLIYMGVSHGLPRHPGKRLVVDIGGGSTEFILGQGLKPLLLESLYMGCVSYSTRFFPEGRVTAKGFQDAQLAAATELQVLTRKFRAASWQQAVGSSGTARALADLLEQNGSEEPGVISAEGLEFLKERLVDSGDPRRMGLSGLRSDRVPVLPGGMAIMCAVFEELGIERMQTTENGLREGVLFEMLGRLEQQDIREMTVRSFMQRYQVDDRQAGRVRGLALGLFRQLASPEFFRQYAAYLDWAARLHEVGLSIAHGGYHKHSAYIIDNADMPGFSRTEQGLLGGLLQGQRGQLGKVAPRVTGREGWMMVLSLRLAVLVHRGRGDGAVPRIRLTWRPRGFAMDIGASWIAGNPLVRSNLLAEMRQWQSLGLELLIRVGGVALR